MQRFLIKQQLVKSELGGEAGAQAAMGVLLQEGSRLGLEIIGVGEGFKVAGKLYPSAREAYLAVTKSIKLPAQVTAQLVKRTKALTTAGQDASNVAKSLSRTSDDLLRPGGKLIGTVQKGATPNIRTVSPQEFAKLQEQLLSGAKPAGQYAGGKGVWYELPSGGRVGVRTSDKSSVTLDIDLPGFPKGFKVHQ